MIFCFRVDSSNKIASGHVVRCITLALKLRQKGHNCIFICRNLPGHLNEIIKKNNFTLLLLSTPKNTKRDISKNTPHSSWLECHWQEDLNETIRKIKNINKVPDWLIIDHYALDVNWHAAIRPYVKRLMVIDDLADREIDCDLLLDQNFFHHPQKRYEKLVYGNCRKLFGPEYALLKSEYHSARAKIKPRDSLIKKILISFGGVDKHNLTYISLRAALEFLKDKGEINVVMPSLCSNEDDIKLLADKNPNTYLHNMVPSLTDLMASSDLAIGACGVTALERLCLCLPSIVCTLATNQIKIAEALYDECLVDYIGHYDIINEDKFTRSLMSHQSNYVPLDFYKRAKPIVDGLGADRVSSELISE